MSGTYEEQIWMGADTAQEVTEGTNTQLFSASTWAKQMPQKRLQSYYVIDAGSPPMPKTLIFPDARTLPKGGPLYNFVCEGDPGVPEIRFTDYTYASLFVTISLPHQVRFYLADNSTPEGLWLWRETIFLKSTQEDLSDIASFGSSDGANLGAVDKYNVGNDTWTTESDSGQDWSRCGASYTGPRAIIRKITTVWSHTAGVTTLQNIGSAIIDGCAFTRAAGTALGGTKHMALGNGFPSNVNDYYDFNLNSFTLFLDHASTDWTDSTSAAVDGPFGAQSAQFLMHVIAYYQTPWFHPIWHLDFNTLEWSPLQVLPHPAYQFAPSIVLEGRVHIMGGGTFRTAVFPTGTQFHQAYNSFNFGGWLEKPWIPNALQGHGISLIPGHRRRCLFSMGKDNSAVPHNNVLAWRYDNLTEAFTVTGSSTWTDRQTQDVSWAQVD